MNPTPSRRLVACAAVVLGTAVPLAGCSSAKKTASASGAATTGGTLKLAFQADMSVVDPDVFYDVEGNVVTLGAYEGLVRYKPNSNDIEGLLAKSWDVSPDRLTYTFHLQSGVTFHDGTPMTASSVKASFQRRKDVNGGSSYMVADIKTMTTPDDSTFVVKLSHPVDAFLDQLASQWGPKVIGPDAIKTHAAKDFGQSYLKDHEDGTGPFQLTTFERGRQYAMTKFAGYWGTKATYDKIQISIVPDISAQRLQLKGGQLDAILHSYTPSDVPAAKKDPSLQVVEGPSFVKTVLYVNEHRPAMSSVDKRLAVAKSLDLPKITSEVYGETATPATGPYPAGMLADSPTLPYGTAPDTTKSASGSITLAYGPDAGGALARVAGLIQIQLQAIGYKVTLKGVQLPDTFEYAKDPSKAPDMLLLSPVSDAAHPATWAGPFWTSEGGINAFRNPDKVVDGLVEKAASAPADQEDALYKQIGQRVIDQESMIFISDVKDVFVLRKGITGISYTPAYNWMVDPAALKPGS